MWLVAVGIVVLIVLLNPKIISEVEGKILPVSSTPLISPAPPPSTGVSGPLADVISSPEKLPPERSDNFLENPALRMMAKQIGTQVYNVVTTGEMQAPKDIGGALLTMFQGDLQIGGQIGLGVGTAVAAILPSIISEPVSAGVATIGGGSLELAGEAGVDAIAGVTGATSGAIGFGIPMVGMVLGEIIGMAFEESSPFSKAQQAVIAQHMDIGPYRLQKLHDLGFTDQQIINWIGDHPEENYWYLMSLLSTYKSWLASRSNAQGFWEPNDRLILNGVFTLDEKGWLDNFAHDLGSDVETVGGEGAGITYYQRTWAEVEGSVGGWHNEYLSLDQAYKDLMAQQLLIAQGYEMGGSFNPNMMGG
jgi:hypothetical protein